MVLELVQSRQPEWKEFVAMIEFVEVIEPQNLFRHTLVATYSVSAKLGGEYFA